MLKDWAAKISVVSAEFRGTSEMCRWRCREDRLRNAGESSHAGLGPGLGDIFVMWIEVVTTFNSL